MPFHIGEKKLDAFSLPTTAWRTQQTSDRWTSACNRTDSRPGDNTGAER